MEMLDLLEKMMKFAGEKVGQKPGDQWKGSDTAPPGKKLVGDSILKDLSKGKTPKSKEQELSEEFQAFLEAEFKDTVDKRPGRKSDRHPRGHEPKPRYKTIKTDEGAPYKDTNEYPALQDPVVAKVVKQMRPGLGLVGLDMANEAFLYYAYELGKDRARADWETYYPAIRTAYMMDKSKHAKELEEGWESGPEEYEEPYDDADDAYERQRQEKIDTEAEKEWAKLPKVSTYKLVGRGPNMEPNYEFGDTEYDTLEQAIEARKQLMADPKTPHPEHIGIQTLTRVIDKESQKELQEINWKKTAASAATALALVASPLPTDAAPFQSGVHKDAMTGEVQGKYSVVKSDNSSATLQIQHSGHQVMGVFINIPNTVIDFSSYGTDGRIKINGKVLPISLQRMNNYSQAGIYPKIWKSEADTNKFVNMVLKTPGELLIEIPIYNQGNRIFKFTIEPEKEKASNPESNTSKIPLEEMTNEAIDSNIVQPMGQDTFNRAGHNPILDKNDYLKRRSDAWNLMNQTTDPQTKAEARQRILDLDRQARAKKYIQSESRGHKIVATKLKDIERSKNFRVPSAEERRELAQRMKDFEAQLAAAKGKKKSKVDEYGATNNVSPYGQPTQKVDPQQAQKIASNLNVQKTALGQLKQINPEIDPQKAATAMTKDPATMNPQEKEAAVQVAKTLSPALGTPAFGSLKTAIQKSQLQAKK